MRRRAMKRQLLVSYSFLVGGKKGSGRTTEFLVTGKKRISPNDIAWMEKRLKEDNDFDAVAIISYQYF
ncbi:hypothetical protein [Bacillus swezeyi]|uniref:Uncharacterized protein n=1 Tax=Bacillus swezeyi TaxID=1925020 RepID=A0A5M8RT51_9BACI|nr:hypothetical protein [Bacillus swezeyi]KAA6450991.1 hypothetical protein DX927_09175 [Bacillus swezeyi]